MPQLHHRDPAIIGLLGAGGQYSTVEIGAVPSLSSSSPSSPLPSSPTTYSGGVVLKKKMSELTLGGASVPVPATSPSSAPSDSGRKSRDLGAGTAEALDELLTPPQTPLLRAVPSAPSSKSGLVPKGQQWADRQRKGMPPLAEGDLYARPYYGLIVDGIHSHPNSVRVSSFFSLLFRISRLIAGRGASFDLVGLHGPSRGLYPCYRWFVHSFRLSYKVSLLLTPDIVSQPCPS